MTVEWQRSFAEFILRRFIDEGLRMTGKMTMTGK